jgi:hypothetical protein
MGFDIVTWPGSLCYTGDMGDFLFQRTADMIAFMRGACMSYSYAAEKCVAHDGRLKEFSEARFEEILRDRLAEATEGLDADCPVDAEKIGRLTAKIEGVRTEFRSYGDPHDAVPISV